MPMPGGFGGAGVGAMPQGSLGPRGSVPWAPSHQAANNAPIVRQTFDWTLAEPVWQRAEEYDDKDLAQALVDRNQQLSPTSAEQSAILSLVTKVTNAIEKLIVAPDLFQAATVDEIKAVGSYKRGTMVTKHNVADLVVILRTLPTIEAVNALGEKIVHDMRKENPKEVFGQQPKDFGCEIAGTQAVVRLLITTQASNVSLLDAELHLDPKTVCKNLAAVRHQRWFDENATHSTIKVLIRLLKDMRKRFAGFRPLNVWMIDLLAHYCVMHTPSRQALSINQAFRRALQLIAAGMFLCGAAGLIDPCEPGFRMHHAIKYEEQDLLCSTAQTLVRVVCHGGCKPVLGLEGKSSMCLEMSVWDGIVVTPLDRAYNKEDFDVLAEDAKAKRQ